MNALPRNGSDNLPISAVFGEAVFLTTNLIYCSMFTIRLAFAIFGVVFALNKHQEMHAEKRNKVLQKSSTENLLQILIEKLRLRIFFLVTK